MESPRDATLRLAKEFAEKGRPDDWFEEFYDRAGGDINKVYWADLEPGPHLVDYLKKHPTPAVGHAITIGCGLGDDAEMMAAGGYDVTAFDISPAAIQMCMKRFPGSKVHYLIADLFEPLESWEGGFDLVNECNTIQILTGENRVRALNAMADLVKPGGVILVSCRSRKEGEGLDVWPLALDKHEIDGFVRAGLTEVQFEAYDDTQDPPVPHFFAVYRRPA